MCAAALCRDTGGKSQSVHANLGMISGCMSGTRRVPEGGSGSNRDVSAWTTSRTPGLIADLSHRHPTLIPDAPFQHLRHDAGPVSLSTSRRPLHRIGRAPGQGQRVVLTDIGFTRAELIACRKSTIRTVGTPGIGKIFAMAAAMGVSESLGAHESWALTCEHAFIIGEGGRCCGYSRVDDASAGMAS